MFVTPARAGLRASDEHLPSHSRAGRNAKIVAAARSQSIGGTPYRSPTGKLPSCRTSLRRRIGEAIWTAIRHVTDALIRQPRYDVQRFYQVAPLQLSTKAIIIDPDDLIAPEDVAERSIDRQAEILITTRQGQCIGFDR